MAVWLGFALLLSVSPCSRAADRAFTGNNGTFDWKTSGNWIGGSPAGADNAFVTNDITGNTVLTNRTGTTLFNDLTMSNNVAFTYSLLLSNNVFRVDGTSRLGRNSIVQIGAGTVAGGASTYSNGNLFLVNNAAVVFNDNSGGLNSLIVAGNFSNDVSTVMSNVGSGIMQMLFTSTTAVTNSGTMRFLSLNNAGNTNFVLQVGTGGAPNTFFNNGTFVLGNATVGSAVSRTYMFSNQLVNAGTFALTNGSTTAGATNWFVVTGNGSATALTNQATGTLKLFGAANGLRNVMTLNSGGFVNAGTLLGESTTANGTNQITLADSTGIFSNAAGGWIVATNNGVFVLQANTLVNFGNVLATNTASLIVTGAVSGAGVFKAGPGATLSFGNGGSLSFANSLFVTGGTAVLQGVFTNSQAGALNVGGSLILTNGSLYNTALSDVVIGNGSSNNALILRADTTWDVAGQNITVGSGAATGNVFTISGAIVTNVNVLNVGNASGTGFLNLNGGALSVKTLLSTNNNAAAANLPTNSWFLGVGVGATLVTSNAVNALASRIVVPENQNLSINGTWLMLGGSNQVQSFSVGSSTVRGNIQNDSDNTTMIVSNGAGLYTKLARNFNMNGNNGLLLITGAGSILSNISQSLNISSGVNNTNISIIVQDGGLVLNTAGLGVGGTGNKVLVTGAGSIWSNFTGASVSGPSSVIISNQGLMYVNGDWNNSSSASGGRIIVTGSGSILTNTGVLNLGHFAGGSSNSVLVKDGGAMFVGGTMLLAGRGGQVGLAGNSNNIITVTDPGSRVIGLGALIIGSDGGAASPNQRTNNSFNGVIVSNSAGLVTASAIIGNLADPSGLFAGNNSNYVVVTGPASSWTNAGALTIGRANMVGNYVTVTNGGIYAGGGAVIVGSGGTANSLNVIGADSVSTFSNNALITVGASGGGANIMTVTNANVWTSGLYVGNGSSNNTVTVQDDVTWDMLNGQLRFGNGTGNTLIASSASTVTNVGGIGLLGTSLTYTLTNNVLMSTIVNVMTAQVYLAGGSITLGSAGLGDNSLTISNQRYQSGATASSVIGVNSSTNYLNILSDVVWDGSGGSLTVGSGASAVSNIVTINGGFVTNFGTISLGGINNSLIVTNGGLLTGVTAGKNPVFGGTSNLFLITTGGTFSNSSTLTVSGSGNTLKIAGGGQMVQLGQFDFSGANSNTILVTDANSLLTVGAVAGGLGGYANRLIVTNGGVANFGAALELGWKSGFIANDQITVTGTGSVIHASSILVGVNSGSAGGGSNIITVSDGGLITMGGFAIGSGTSGSGPSSNNLFLVTNGGVVTNTGFTGLGSLTYDGNNVIRVTGTNSLWYSSGSAFALASYTGAATTNNGGNWLDVTNAATFYNAGALNVGVSPYGQGNNSNRVTVTSATFTNIGLITVGAGAANDFNTMTVSNSSVGSGGLTIGSASSSNNAVTVLSGTTWDMLNGAVTIGANATTGNVLRLEGNASIIKIGTLRLTNSLNQFLFNGGTVSLATGYVSNQIFRVGDGIQSATLQSLVGTQIYAGGLLIMSNAVLKGTGTIRGTLTINGGATIAPGNSPGILNVENLTWAAGGIYSNDLVDFSAGAGTGWDYINGSGALTFGGPGENFILRLDSGGVPAANFDNLADYTLAIAGFAGGISGFDASRFTIDTNAFLNAHGGSFGLTVGGTTLYLTYSGITLTPGFVWSNAVNASWSAAGAWTNGAAPLVNGSATQVLQFNGSGSASYIANNDQTTTGISGSYTNNRIVFNSTSTATNTLAGATLTFTGPSAGIFQTAGGAFIVSNSIELAGDLNLRGVGVGTVILASNITGTGQVTLGGAYNTVLQGSNTFVGPVLVSSSGGTLTLANLAAIGTNSLTVSNGTVASSVAYTLGRGWSNQAVLITGSAAYWTNTAALTIGAGESTGNTLAVQNSGSLYVNGSLVIGTNGAAVNSLVISNGGRVFGTTASTADAYVGFAAGSNTVQIVGGGTAASPSVWNGGGRFVYVGSGVGGVSNSLVFDGRGVTGSAVLTNVQINVGANAVGAFNNVLIVTNGGVVARGPSTSITIIGANGARSNAVFIIGGGPGGGISEWANGVQPFRIGSGSGGGSLIGANRLIVDGNGVVGGAVLRNVGTLTVGEQESWDSLMIANGGSVSSAGAVIIGNGIGANANNNTATISGSAAASVWNLGNSSLTIGSATTGVATNNTAVIGTGGTVTNVSTATIGVGTARTNALVLNGGQFWATSVIATSAGNRAVLNAGTLGVVGMTYSNGTAFVIGDGSSAAALQLGGGTHKFDQGITLLTNSYLKGNGATLGATITNTLIGGAIAIGADAGNTFTVNGVIQGTASQLTKQEGGTVVLTGNSTFAAPVAVNAGTLTIANTSGTGIGTLAPVTVSGGNFVVNNSGGTGVAGNIAVNSGTFLINNSGASVGAAGIVTGAGGFITGNGTISGGVILNAGTLTAGNSSLDTLNMGSLTVNGGYLPFEFLTTGVNNDKLNVTDSGGLTINGGTVLLYTNNSTVRFDAAGLYNLIQYSGSIGGTGVSAFTVGNQANNRVYNFGLAGGYVTLSIGGNGEGWNPSSPLGDTWWTNAANWGGGSGPAPVAFDQLLFDGNTKVNNTNNFASHTKFAGIVFTNSAGVFVLNGMAVGTNAVNLVGDVVNRSGNTQTINLPLVLEGGSRGFNTASGNMIANGVISGADSTAGLIKSGTNGLTLTGANTYSGITEIRSGILRATDGVGLPTASNLKLNGGVLETSGTFSRSLGTAGGSVQWSGSGGFSASGGTLSVNLGGSGAGVTWASGNFVPDGGSLIFGSSAANGTVKFINPLDLNGAMRTVQVAQGAAIIDADMIGALSGGGSSGLAKLGAGTMRLSGNSTYSGATVVNGGTLLVDGRLASGTLNLAGGTVLAGTGTLASVIGGAGLVAPGQSPGILAVNQVDPSGGLDFNFEFTNIGSPNYVQPGEVNDVLRITNSTPFTAALGIANTVSLYISGVTLLDGATNWFRGGFYTDTNLNFDASITGATYRWYLNNTLQGAPIVVRTVDEGLTQFGGIDGYVMEFGVLGGQTILSVVPEPNVLLLWLAGGLTVYFSRRRRSRSGASR